MAAATSTLNTWDNVPATPPDAQQPKQTTDNSVRLLSSKSTIVSFDASIKAPFGAIGELFDHLRANPQDASLLNSAYPKRGIFKCAAIHNTTSDQKFTVDLSPTRNHLIPQNLCDTLPGFNQVIDFFSRASTAYVPAVMSAMSNLAGGNGLLSSAHSIKSLADGNINFRLCDYNTSTADPISTNGCGAHIDYGTFSIIFQDGTPGLEMEEEDGQWIPIPGDATVILAGWCATILSGGTIQATRHRVRRTPGKRRLSAVMFVAPDLDVELKPMMEGRDEGFSDRIMRGEVDVRWFKEVMGKRWRHREGNDDDDDEGTKNTTQDEEIERLVYN